jgi:hypothetical protein
MSAEFSASSVSHTVIGVDPAGALERMLTAVPSRTGTAAATPSLAMSPAATSSRGASASLATEATAAYASR